MRLRLAVRQLDQIVYDIISKAGSAEGQDLITLLSQSNDGGTLSDRQVRDEAMTILFAGHETTALALSWCRYLLSQHPSVDRWLGTELDRVLPGGSLEVADLPRLSEVGKVVREAIRHYWPVTRSAAMPCLIPLWVNIVWPWLERGRSTAIRASFSTRWISTRYVGPLEFEHNLPRFAYCQFGGGPRICLDRQFSIMEATLLLAALRRRFRTGPRT